MLPHNPCDGLSLAHSSFHSMLLKIIQNECENQLRKIMAKIVDMVIGWSYAESVVGQWTQCDAVSAPAIIIQSCTTVFAIIVTERHFDGNASQESHHFQFSHKQTHNNWNCRYRRIMQIRFFRVCVGSDEGTKRRKIESKMQIFCLVVGFFGGTFRFNSMFNVVGLLFGSQRFRHLTE